MKDEINGETNRRTAVLYCACGGREGRFSKTRTCKKKVFPIVPPCVLPCIVHTCHGRSRASALLRPVTRKTAWKWLQAASSRGKRGWIACVCLALREGKENRVVFSGGRCPFRPSFGVKVKYL